MSKANRPKGKTRTHFEQIPVALVEKIAIADVPDTREIDRRLVDRGEETAPDYDIRRVSNRRKSTAAPPSPSGNES